MYKKEYIVLIYMPSRSPETKSLATAAKPGRRPRTSHEEIVECAVRMLAREGADALTFRAVAREADIAVGAFSRYFKSLAELEDAIAASIIAKISPLDANDQQGLREQLIRQSVEWLQITRTYPALGTYHGPASTTALAEHLGKAMKVMTSAGIDLERAMMIYGIVVNLAYGWGLQISHQPSKKLQKQGMQAFVRQFGALTPKTAKLLEASENSDVYHRSFVMLIDGLLPARTTPAKKR